MSERGRRNLWLVAVAAVGLGGGCRTPDPTAGLIAASVPREQCKVLLPEYTVEPPDILQIDLVQAVPLPPYKVQSLDTLAVTVPNALESDPINGPFPVDPDGTVNLGPRYGAVKVAGLTLAEAKAEVAKALAELKDPKVTVALLQGRAPQVIRGQHLVRPDGTVSLGTYGSVVVAGMTPTLARKAIEAHLGKSLQEPEVAVSVLGYNSKVIYVVYDLGGSGQKVERLPSTGNDTVLDAVAQLSGLAAVSDPARLWVARPAGPGEPDLILPVDWHGLTSRGRADTNFQLLPGDRLYVQAYPLVAFDTALARLLNPLERVFGFSLLGASTVRTLQFKSGVNTGLGGL